MNFFSDIPSFDFFNIPESLPETFEQPLAPNRILERLPKKTINLNDVKNPARETYLQKIREKIEKNKEKMS